MGKGISNTTRETITKFREITMLEPLSNHLLIEPEEKELPGFIIPDTARKDRPSVGIVRAIGPKIQSVSLGDKVLLKTYMIDELEIDNKKYMVGQEDCVIGKIK